MLKQCAGYVAESPPFSWFANQEVFQFLLLGLANSGKTTLLYRLKIEGWKKAEIVRDMQHLKRIVDPAVGCRDPAYHYEEMRGGQLGKYGIWDVPGNPVLMRMWPIFYRYLRIEGVIFVVDARPEAREDLDMIEEARQQIHFLLNENELRCAAFFLILNVDTPETGHKSEEDEQWENALYEMLGVPEIEQQPSHESRFFKFAINCAEITQQSPKWEQVLKAAYRVLVRSSDL